MVFKVMGKHKCISQKINMNYIVLHKIFLE